MPQSYGTPDAPQVPTQSVAAPCSLALAFGLVVLSTITQMVLAERVLRVDRELPLRADQRQVFVDRDAAVVKEHVMVGAQAQYVVRRVGAVVG